MLKELNIFHNSINCQSQLQHNNLLGKYGFKGNSSIKHRKQEIHHNICSVEQLESCYERIHSMSETLEF